MVKFDIRKPNKIKADFSVFVSFKYDPSVVTVMRSLPCKFYSHDTHEWEIPIEKIEWVKEKLEGFDFKVKGATEQLEKIGKKQEFKIPENFSFKTKPFEHQYEAFKYGMLNDRWFLGDEMGLGKTKMSLDIAVARKIKYGYEHCMIVCGVNTLKWNWVNEIKTHTDEKCWILGQRTLKNGKVQIGSTKDKFSDLEFIEESDDKNLPYFLITNVESFRDKQIADEVKKLCADGKIKMCIADELHKMKNPTSQQTKGFLKCDCECEIAMTGTPLMNNPLDLYVILKWLGYENHSFYAFKNHYCITGGFGGYEIVGYKNMEQLTNQMSDIMLRRKKEDVFDLPEKTYIDEYVDMTPKQAVIYKEVENDIKTNIDMVEFENNPLAMLIRLRQATGYTGILSSEIQESAKLDRMEDIVDEAVSNGKKCLIFSNWTQMTDAIMERLNTSKKWNYHPCLITGQTNDADRQHMVELFQTCDDNKVIVGTIGAMGTGLTLTAGTVVIFLDEPWNKALFDQAVDRAHRVGTTENVTVYSLMCKETIDERIHELIYKKGLMSDMIIDGHIIGDKSKVLNYLLG